MRPIIVQPSGSSDEMLRAIESTINSAGMTSGCVKCGDNAESISSFLRQALSSSKFVMLIGAMGPDGVGRAAAANVLSLPMVKNHKAESYIKERCLAAGEDPAKYFNCAMMPRGAVLLSGDNIIPACFCAVEDNVLILMDCKEDNALLERLGALLLSLNEVTMRAATPAAIAAAAAQLPDSEEEVAAQLRKKEVIISEADEIYYDAHSNKKGDMTSKVLIAAIVVAAMLTVTALGIFLGIYFGNDEPARPANKVVYKPVTSSAVSDDDDDWEELIVIEDDEEEEESSDDESEPQIESEPAASSKSESAASTASSQQSEQSSSLADSQTVVIWEAESSSEPQTSSSVPESSAPAAASSSEAVSSEPEQSSQPEPEPEPEPEPDDEEDFDNDDIDAERYDDEDLPSAKRSVFDDKLSYTTGSSVKKMNAYDLVCQILENETRGNFAPEALKAHAVATYSMIKYNNQKGTAPSVSLNSNVSQAVKDAVDDVLGVGVYYNGQFANTVYHSTSGGKTTSSQAVWGGALPYLTSVNSSYDKKSPSYESTYTVSSTKFARLVDSVYGIELDGDPEDWIEVERDSDGDYVGTVIIGGEAYAQGGSYGDGKKITGRSIREQLFRFALRSHCFEVQYDDNDDEFVFTVYGYGHGVGMSQYGAHFMALDGYNFVEILHHYYPDTDIY